MGLQSFSYLSGFHIKIITSLNDLGSATYFIYCALEESVKDWDRLFFESL